MWMFVARIGESYRKRGYEKKKKCIASHRRCITRCKMRMLHARDLSVSPKIPIRYLSSCHRKGHLCVYLCNKRERVHTYMRAVFRRALPQENVITSWNRVKIGSNHETSVARKPWKRSDIGIRHINMARGTRETCLCAWYVINYHLPAYIADSNGKVQPEKGAGTRTIRSDRFLRAKKFFGLFPKLLSLSLSPKLSHFQRKDEREEKLRTRIFQTKIVEWISSKLYMLF